MGKSKAPKPTDPRQSASASIGSNIASAVANTAMGNVNQIGPDGSLTYSMTGKTAVYDPFTGTSYNIPQYSATTSLTGDAKTAHDIANKNKITMGNAAAGRLGELGGTRQNILDSLMMRMRPEQDRQAAMLESRLANQGLSVGSKGYNSAKSLFNTSLNDAFLGAILASGQEEGQMINNINALSSGGSVAVPNYTPNTPARAPTTDTAGLIANADQQKMGAWQTDQANRQNLLGGLFGLGSAFLLSDRRAKTDIKKVEERDGPDVYEYRYKSDQPGTVRRGYMAQDVKKEKPSAVKRFGKYFGVDYSQLPAV